MFRRVTLEPDLQRLDAIAKEAVRLHGTDWLKVERHIAEAIAALPPDEADRLQRAMEPPADRDVGEVRN
jgi:hypothetical protein